MKKLLTSTAAKTAAFLLACLTAVLSVGGLYGIIYMLNMGYYDAGVSSAWDLNAVPDTLDTFMNLAVDAYCDPTDDYAASFVDRRNTNVLLTIEDENGELLWSTLEEGDSYSYSASGVFTLIPDPDTAEESTAEATNETFAVQSATGEMTTVEVTGETDSDDTISGTEATASVYSANEADSDELMTITVTAYVRSPLKNASFDSLYTIFKLFSALYPLRYFLIGATPAAAICLALLLAFLLRAVGHRREQDGIVLNWLDRIPAEILVFAMLTAVGLSFELPYGANWIGENSLIIRGSCYGLWGFCLATLALASLLTIVNRTKAHCFWRSFLVVRLWNALHGRMKAMRGQITGEMVRDTSKQALDVGRHGAQQAGKLLQRGAKGLFHVLRVFGSRLGEFLRGLPGAWGLIIPAAMILLLEGLFAYGFYESRDHYFILLFWILDIAILLLVWRLGMNFTRLLDACQRLASGDLTTKTNTRHMRWKFKTAAEALNAVGDGMSVAVEARMKSERMKTELITNVSHDIKTPLTSIVNYVDLLSKEPLETEAAREYVSVLERQAQRLKKLIEDLVEASKASTGNLTVDLAPVDLGEFLHQAAAEYQEALEKASLTPVVQVPEQPLYVLADGKHLWRILDNLLGNACKYAQPGTRVYLCLVPNGEEVYLLVKNISREPLNISPDELMERFVRGDSSRTTEGSGLGLSIARSLAEIQGARFDLSIDGDLFKAEIALKRLRADAPAQLA